jgi:hypothetical protein
MIITAAVVQKLLTVVDAGLVKGVGVPEPGKMCVEAAVCYVLNLPHDDNPQCVTPALRELKIRLNDCEWSSPQARAKGLRRLAVAQLGSAGIIDEQEFRHRIVGYALRSSVASALRSAASVCTDHKAKAALLNAATRCESDATREAALEARKTAAAAAAYAAAAAAAYAAAAAADAAAADAAAYAAAAAACWAANAAAVAAADADADAARDKSLAEYAEAVVQILIDMKTPGCQWLVLTEAS